MTRTTVLIPSHAHGPLLELSADTALRQTESDLELFIVLDGADDATRSAAARVAASDSRVRVFDFPKGERLGEAHRDVALAEARGEIVCYLADDDLWFPDHIAYLTGLLANADLAHASPIRVGVGGELEMPWIGDLADPWFRSEMAEKRNFVPLSTAGHTLAAYRALPVGWSPAPPDFPTDAHMWLKFAAVPGMRFATGGRPTVVNLPSARRPGVPLDERLAELERMHERLTRDPEGLRLAGFEGLMASAALLTRQARTTAAEAKDARRRARALRRRLAKSRRQLRAVERSMGYRIARRLARIPVVGTLGRALTRLVSRR